MRCEQCKLVARQKEKCTNGGDLGPATPRTELSPLDRVLGYYSGYYTGGQVGGAGDRSENVRSVIPSPVRATPQIEALGPLQTYHVRDIDTNPYETQTQTTNVVPVQTPTHKDKRTVQNNGRQPPPYKTT